MNELVEVIECAAEPWEEIQCEECGAVLRFHPTKAMKKCEYFDGWYNWTKLQSA